MNKPVAMQLDLFGGPATPHLSDPIPPPRAAPVAPPTVLEGQLDLLEARAVRLASVGAALSAGRISDAAMLLREHPHEHALRAAIEALATSLVRDAFEGPQSLAALALLDDAGPPTIAAAARRGIAVQRATALESSAPSMEAAVYWLVANRTDDAARVLNACVAANIERARAHEQLAALATAAGDPVRTRSHYRSAFWADGKLPPAGLSDPAIQSAIDEAPSLVPAPIRAWLPLVGFALGLWPLGPCEADDPASPAARFHAALMRARTASRTRRINVESRREMKRLAPELFALLLDEGKL